MRKDSLPEGATYRDDGCEYAPKCTECPFEICVKHESGGASNIMAFFNEPRNESIRALKEAGVPVDRLSKEFGVSKRTVFRVSK